MIALAVLVAAVHALTITTVILGSLAAVVGLLRQVPRLEIAFYSLVALVIASDLLYGDCILTHLEKLLRNVAEPGSAYLGSYIGHYLPWLPRGIHSHVGPGLVIAGILACPFWRWMDRRRGRAAARASGA